MIFKRLKLENFKGKTQDIAFKDGVNIIYGKNGSGKSTIFDAISWVLFGKDYQDRKQFDILPIKDGNKSNVVVSVELIIEADEEHTLKRILKNNLASCEFDGIPLKVGEFTDYVSKLTDGEERFKIYSNPFYFIDLHWKAQRDLLMSFFPKPSHDEVFNAYDASVEFMDELNAKKHFKVSDILTKFEAQFKEVKEKQGQADIVESRFEKSEVDIAEKELARLGEIQSKFDILYDDMTEQVKTNSELSFEVETLERHNLLLQGKILNAPTCPSCGFVMSDIDAIREEIKTTDDMIGEKKKQIKKVSGEELDECIKNRHDANEAYMKQLDHVRFLKMMMEKQEKADALKKQSKAELAVERDRLERLILECNTYIQTSVRLITDKLNSVLDGVKVVLYEKQKSGEYKNTFILTDDVGIPLESVNSAKKLELVMQIVAFIKKSLDVEIPLVIDNAERYTDIDFEVGRQSIIAIAQKNEPLTINGKEI